jgi:hypothetical protein
VICARLMCCKAHGEHCPTSTGLSDWLNTPGRQENTALLEQSTLHSGQDSRQIQLTVSMEDISRLLNVKQRDRPPSATGRMKLPSRDGIHGVWTLPRRDNDSASLACCNSRYVALTTTAFPNE